MNAFVIKLCWKNIWRNKRRTLITVSAISFGVMWLIWAYNYYDAFHEQIIGNAIRYRTGHLIVATPEYHKRPITSRFVEDPMAVEQWLSITREVKAHSPRIHLQGLLSSANNSVNIQFSGIDPKRESKITNYSNALVSGEFFPTSVDKPIVVGVKLAENLKLKIGSKVVALTQGVDGSIGNELFYVVGIFQTHAKMDETLAFILLEDARALLSLPKRAVHEISVLLYQDREYSAVIEKFSGAFPNEKYKMLSWKQIERHLMSLIQLHKAANHSLMFIVLFVACLGIANAVLMSLLERTKELGVMMAIGTSKWKVAKMVFTETFLLTVLGVVLGNVMGVSATIYFNQKGFDLQWLTSQEVVMEGSLIETVTYPSVQWMNCLSVTGVILLLTVLATMVPLQHISKLSAIKALNSR